MNRFTVCVAVALVLMPSAGIAACANGSTCGVGAFGQGGVSSGGSAQGGQLKYMDDASPFPGEIITNVGNAKAGRASAADTTINGVAQGDTFRGHGTGIVGTWSGQCDLDDYLLLLCE